MEPVGLIKRKLSRSDLVTGIGGSFLVHIAAFSAAFIGAWIMPHKPIKPPYATVNLVSLQDLGMGASEPKGAPNAPDVAPKAPDTVRPSGRGKSDSTGVPVKRLQLDESVKRTETHIKKVDPKETPKIAEAPQSLSAIEKDLEKLIPKPKVIPRATAPAEPAAESQPQPAAQPAPSGRPAKIASGNENAVRGTPNGAADAGARGATQGSTVGSPEGTGASNALLGLYGQKVKAHIEQHWRLANDQGVAGLKAVVEVQIKKTGEVVSVNLVKSSGNATFDDAAVRAVNRASPMPAVPEAIVQPSTVFKINFVPGRIS